MSGIPVVLFDLDDTLFAHREAVEAAVTAVRAGLSEHAQHDSGSDSDGDAVERVRWRDLEEHHYHRYLAGELDFLGQRRARVRDFLGPYGIELVADAAVDDWWAGYFAGYQRAWRLHDDAIRVLDTLGDRRLGLITNGDLVFQTAKLDAVGLADRIEHVIASGELGVTKPDPRIFEHACTVFGVEPGDAAYIGDRLRTDALGAAAAGLLGIWLDRLGTATDDERAECAAAGVPIIRTLDDLPALLP